MKQRLAIFKHGYVDENGKITDDKFIKAGFNYEKIFKEAEILGCDYFCAQQEVDSLTKEWVSNDNVCVEEFFKK